MIGQTDDRHAPVQLRRRVFSWPTVLAFVVALSFIYFLSTRFQVDWDKTWQTVLALDPRLYLVGFGLYYISFVFRGLRWRFLARNAGISDSPETRLPSVLKFSQLIVMGWFVNSIAWLHIGDAYRAYALSEESKSAFSWSLGTVLAERVVDMVAVLVLIVVGAALFSVTRDTSGAGYFVGAAFVMASALGGVLAFMKGYGARAARFLPGRLESAYTRFQEGALGSLRQRQLPVIFVLGLAGWLLETGRLYFVVHSLGLSIGIPLVLIVALGHAILSTVGTPGGVGAVEPGVTGLLMLDMAREEAVSIALVDRSITYLSIIVLGGLTFLAWQLSRRRQRANERHAAEAVPQGQGVADA